MIKIAVYGEDTEAAVVAEAIKKLLSDFGYVTADRVAMRHDEVYESDTVRRVATETMSLLSRLSMSTNKVEIDSVKVNNIYHVIPAKADIHRVDV